MFHGFKFLKLVLLSTLIFTYSNASNSHAASSKERLSRLDRPTIIRMIEDRVARGFSPTSLPPTNIFNIFCVFENFHNFALW